MAELFYIREGLMVKGNTYLTGSLIATAGITGSFTGSLTGTATTASYVNPTFISASVAASGFGGSSVTINNNTNDYVVTATGTANTLNGESALTFNGTTLSVANGSVSATPSQLLLKTTGAGGAGLQFENSAFPTNKWQVFVTSDSTGFKIGRDNVADYFTIAGSTGYVGIGNNSPSAKLDVNGSAVVSGSLTITQNLTVLGSSSIQYITSSQLNIANNLITVNTNTPGIRFGGLAVIDSGSSPQRSGSLLFDSQDNQWVFVHQNNAGAVTSSILIMGPETYNNVGNETNLTTNRLPKSTNAEHIGDSNISDTGTVVSINSNTQITGSLVTTSGITGSLQGTATTASYVLNAISASYAPSTTAFPYTGNASISGSLVVTGSGGGKTYIGSSYTYPSLSVIQFENGAPSATNWNILGGTSTMALNSPGGRLDFNVNNQAAVYIYPGYTSFRYNAVFGDTSIAITPTSVLQVRGGGTTSATTAFLVQNSTPSEIFKITDNGQTTISGTGVPLIVNSTNSNTFKMSLQDAGVVRGYFGSGNGIPLMVGDLSGNPTHTFYGTGTISSLGGIYIGDASTTPSGQIHTKGTGATSATTNILVQNSSAANLFRITDDGRVTITGSLGISGGVTGSLRGTASYATQALSASYAPSAGGAAFPYTGAAQITGSLIISSSNSTQLTLLGSGSTVPIFTVQGSQGELFSITDSLSGSLFSVNDLSGLPILEVFSDSTTFIGDYQAPALYTTKKITASSGINTIYSLNTGSYDGVFVDYIIRSGSNSRAGNFKALWGSGGVVNFTDSATADIGSTSGFTIGASVSGPNMVVTGSASTSGWTIKAIIRSI
jgi:hypothetical protein